MRPRQRGLYVTLSQKKKLIELITKYPELISCKVTPGFNYADSQKLWLMIANECNSIPGAKKTWRQWKKTWQDIRSNVKKKQRDTNGELPMMATMLTTAEQEALGIKNVSSTTHCQTTQEFVTLECTENDSEQFENEVESAASFSEPESPHEQKVFTQSPHKNKKLKTNNKHKCYFNCDMLAVHEQKKLKIKEDYYNFKKDYLKQKLILIKEQTEALKSIAKGLSK